MIRVTAFAAVVLMTAAVQPAAAQTRSVIVQVAGRSEAAVREDIHRAAHEVCSDQDFQLGVAQMVETTRCEKLAERQALQQFAQALPARPAANQEIATLSPPAKPGRP
jgi:hypothetical protein